MGRELPILFNTDMVQAILEGRKTVTRRLCKDANIYIVPDMGFYDAEKRTYAVHNYADKEHHKKLSMAERRCPICPDDILYVRETWAFMACIECSCTSLFRVEKSCGRKPHTYEDKDSIAEGCFVYRAGYPQPERLTWHPSIHMPKEAARIWIKVTDVRVERLQEMKLDDFLSEGVILRPEAFNDPANAYMQAREQFIEIWNATIPKGQQDLYSWEADPWVWAIEFERCG